MDDFVVYGEDLLRIRTKSGEILPLVLNECQRELHRRAEEQRARTGRIRVLVLKGRQEGISTYIEGRLYWRVTLGVGLRAFILAHMEDATSNLFAMAQRYHTYMDPDYKPATKASNRTELDFRHLDGGYRLATANSPDSGRSDTIQLFHGSEVAFWRNAKPILAGALQAVPKEDGTEVWLESTANGRGGEFYRMWDRAERAERGEIDPKTGQPYTSEFIAVFLPWYWMARYKSRVPDHFERTKQEEALVRAYGLSDEQLQWRREKIEEFGGDEDLFKQEYPCCASEAFLFSGRKVFPAKRIDQMRLTVKTPIARGIIEERGEKVAFVEDEDGWLEIYAWPVPGRSYTVGVDIAEGKEDGDKNSGHVLSRSPRVAQCARFAPFVEPDEMGRYSVRVARYYNNAVVGIERNNQGIASVIAARDTGYQHLFAMTSVDEDGQTRPKLGWITSVTSRPVMINDLVAAVRDGSIDVWAIETIGELEVFVRGDNGRPEAAEGEHDDEVIGLAIALQMVMRSEPTTDNDEADIETFMGATIPWDG